MDGGKPWRLVGGGYGAVEWGRIGRVLRALALVLGNTPATKPLKIPQITARKTVPSG